MGALLTRQNAIIASVGAAVCFVLFYYIPLAVILTLVLGAAAALLNLTKDENDPTRGAPAHLNYALLSALGIVWSAHFLGLRMYVAGGALVVEWFVCQIFLGDTKSETFSKPEVQTLIKRVRTVWWVATLVIFYGAWYSYFATLAAASFCIAAFRTYHWALLLTGAAAMFPLHYMLGWLVPYTVCSCIVGSSCVPLVYKPGEALTVEFERTPVLKYLLYAFTGSCFLTPVIGFTGGPKQMLTVFSLWGYFLVYLFGSW